MAEEKEATKAERILDAALDLFIERGFAETPMDLIAERSGVAKGTLYYHYKSKEGIVDALLERFGDRIDAELSPVLSDPATCFTRKAQILSLLITRLFTENNSRLHRMRYIDIHEKTAMLALRRLIPYHVKLIEIAAGEGLCSAEHAREFSEIFVAAGQFLLDPEFGVERMEARMRAMVIMAERSFGFAPGTFPMFGFMPHCE